VCGLGLADCAGAGDAAKTTRQWWWSTRSRCSSVTVTATTIPPYACCIDVRTQPPPPHRAPSPPSCALSTRASLRHCVSQRTLTLRRGGVGRHRPHDDEQAKSRSRSHQIRAERRRHHVPGAHVAGRDDARRGGGGHACGTCPPTSRQHATVWLLHRHVRHQSCVCRARAKEAEDGEGARVALAGHLRRGQGARSSSGGDHDVNSGDVRSLCVAAHERLFVRRV
jgi:hypothetical protein